MKAKRRLRHLLQSPFLHRNEVDGPCPITRKVLLDFYKDRDLPRGCVKC